MAWVSSVSKMLWPEAFSGSNDFASYITHFEIFSELQNKKSTLNSTKTDERPQYFALRMKNFFTRGY